MSTFCGLGFFTAVLSFFKQGWHRLTSIEPLTSLSFMLIPCVALFSLQSPHFSMIGNLPFYSSFYDQIGKFYYGTYTAQAGTAIRTAILNALQSVSANTGLTFIDFGISGGEQAFIIFNYSSRRALALCGDLYYAVINSARDDLSAFQKFTKTSV